MKDDGSLRFYQWHRQQAAQAWVSELGQCLNVPDADARVITSVFRSLSQHIARISETGKKIVQSYKPRKTREQIKWDGHEDAAAELMDKIIGYACDPNWARKPVSLEELSDVVSDLDRELRALRIIGYREGDSVGPIPKLSQIEARPVVCGINGEDAA